MGVDQNAVAVRGPDDLRYELGGRHHASDEYVVSAGHYRSWAWSHDLFYWLAENLGVALPLR
ncbi:hypothetical protein AB0M22_17025 [Nocardia sp. NPDC051756]|uniref:hypothetical protein n=1 Tax=Nocardia sp. NPDC051756 TaxID=3154751 RepID=UPI00342E387D